MADEILTLKEVAEYLKLAEKTAYRLAAEGRLPGFKVGGSWRKYQQQPTRDFPLTAWWVLALAPQQQYIVLLVTIHYVLTDRS